jgi:hypothetical protein
MKQRSKYVSCQKCYAEFYATPEEYKLTSITAKGGTMSKKPKNRPERCQEHGLYLYANGQRWKAAHPQNKTYI